MFARFHDKEAQRLYVRRLSKSSKGTYYIYSFVILEFEEMTKLKLYTNHVQTVATTPVKLQKSISKKIYEELQTQSNHFLHLFLKYSQISLSQTRLFRITVYLKVKIWSLF